MTTNDTTPQDMQKLLKINIVAEVLHGVEGEALILNGYRVVGPKAWGGGTVTKKWRPFEIENILSAVPELEAYIRSLEQKCKDLYADAKSWESRAIASQNTVDRMTTIMVDNDVLCQECSGDLTRAEMQEGICTDCSRHLS